MNSLNLNVRGVNTSANKPVDIQQTGFVSYRNNNLERTPKSDEVSFKGKTVLKGKDVAAKVKSENKKTEREAKQQRQQAQTNQKAVDKLLNKSEHNQEELNNLSATVNKSGTSEQRNAVANLERVANGGKTSKQLHNDGILKDLLAKMENVQSLEELDELNKEAGNMRGSETFRSALCEKKKLLEKNAEIARLSTEISELQSRLNSVTDEKNNANIEIGKQNKANKQLKRELTEQATEIKNQAKQITEHVGTINEQKNKIAEQASQITEQVGTINEQKNKIAELGEKLAKNKRVLKWGGIGIAAVGLITSAVCLIRNKNNTAG